VDIADTKSLDEINSKLIRIKKAMHQLPGGFATRRMSEVIVGIY